GVEIDTSAAQKAIDELDQRIRDTVSFEIIRNGVPFIKGSTIANGAIHAAAIQTPQPVTNIYNISFDIMRDEPAQNKVTISTDKFEVKPGIDANTEALIESSLKNAAECAALDDLAKTIRKAIHNECLAGGIIWQRFSR
ncbi:Fur-regulated protein, partial [Citrobacter freundii]|nr:Fur-regulated protein [Citrobacter freundii]